MELPSVIDSDEAIVMARQLLTELLSEGDASKAVAIAEQLVSGQDQRWNVEQLKAIVYVEGGTQLEKPEMLAKGARILQDLSSRVETSDFRYNLASVEHRQWNLAVKQKGFEQALLDSYDHLRNARNLFDSIADDSSASLEERLKALTDAGNSYDEVGRYLDALEKYDRALNLDPTFAMALGNRGMALFYLAPLMGSYGIDLLREAADCLDAALDDQEGLAEHGGNSATDAFRKLRTRIVISPDESEFFPASPASFEDPYLQWCLGRGLFLHVSPDHIQQDTDILDSISFKTFTHSISDKSLLLANSLIDAFSTLKQDYTSARYLLWLATSRESPISEHSRAISKRVSYWETASYARFSARTGLAVQAHRAAVDLMDKIAAFVHLYLGSNQVRGQITFDKLASPSKGRLPAYLADALKPPERNQGLMALLDLQRELREDPPSPLKQRTIRRHRSTHTFLVVHHMGAGDSIPMIDRVDWDRLIKESLDQLRFVRGALLYLANMIELHEDVSRGEGKLGLLPIERADPDFMDLD